MTLPQIVALFITVSAAASVAAQTADGATTHDISQVEVAPVGGAIAVPLNRPQSRMFRKYSFPDLQGSRQALGSQLIEGRLPKPLLDYTVHVGEIDQRLSFFEGGLTVVQMSGAGGTIRKKLLIPIDAQERYLKPFRSEGFRQLKTRKPASSRVATVRVYDDEGLFSSWIYDPGLSTTKSLDDAVAPLSDLLRAISEDRTVTNSIAGYQPKVGDLLVSDDSKIYRVERLMDAGRMVEVRCTSEPLISYIETKDLYNYFMGKPDTLQ